MCARFFYLILAALFVFVTVTVAAFVYLQWWQAILASAATLVLLVLAGKVLIQHFVGSFAKLAKGLFEQKSRVLKNATADVHSVKKGVLPKPLAEWIHEVESRRPGHDEADEESTDDVTEAERLRNGVHWYEIDASIYPDTASAKGMTHWDIDDLRLVSFDRKISDDPEAEDDAEDYELHDVHIVEDGSARSAEESKFHGPQRLRFTVGVPPGQRLLKFRYYFETFGRIELPPPMTLRIKN